MSIVKVLVVFFLLGMLWIPLIAGFYLAWKKGVIARKGKFFLTSVAVGYLVLFFGSFPFTLLFKGILQALGISGESANGENVRHTLAVVTMVIQFLLPVLSTHYIAKKFS